MAPESAAVPVRYQRSEHLVGHWGRDALQVRNFATGRAAFVSDFEWALVETFATWRTVEEAAELHQRAVARVRRATDRLHRYGFLIREDEEPRPAEARMRAFAPWNPEVGYFHTATRNVRFMPLADARAVQRKKAVVSPWPGAVFAPPGRSGTPLPPPPPPSPVTRAFLNRRSWRRFGTGPMDLAKLATLLWLTGGVQYWVQSDVGEFALKTSPSGGSLHPIELYVLARRVRGLTAGTYHYGAGAHALTPIERHEQAVPVERYLPQQPWFEGSAAVVFFVAHYERALWRYAYPRAYRAAFVEAGHLAQTFCVKATDLGLAPFVTMALADSAIEQSIEADGVMRSVLYAAGVGLRPRGLDWAPHPEGSPRAARRANRIRRPGRAR